MIKQLSSILFLPFLLGAGSPVDRRAPDPCPDCIPAMVGTAFPLVDATGIWVPGVKTPGKCEGEPCAGALQCRFSFTAGVVINTPGVLVTVRTTFSLELPGGATAHYDYPPFDTGAFTSNVENWPVPCGGMYASAIFAPGALLVLGYGLSCGGCL